MTLFVLDAVELELLDKIQRLEPGRRVRLRNKIAIGPRPMLIPRRSCAYQRILIQHEEGKARTTKFTKQQFDALRA